MIGHSKPPQFLFDWLYMFHMPLFFFLSGYVFNWGKHRDFKQFFRSRCYSLLIPSLILGAILDAFYLTMDSLTLGSFDGKVILYNLLGALIQLRGGNFQMGLWFVSCLFTTELLFWCMLYYLKKPHRVIAGLMFFSVVGFLYVQLIGKIVPWSMDVMCIAVGFFGAGYYCRNVYSGWFDKACGWFLLPLYVAVTAAVLLLNRLLHQRVNLYMDEFGSYPLLYIGAFAGILTIVSLFRNLPPLRLLIFLGQNSLAYFALHFILFPLFRLYLPYKNWILFCSLATIIIAPVAMLLNRYLPIAVGKVRIEPK